MNHSSMKKCFQFPNKNRYNTRYSAETAALMSENRHLRVYHCDSCDGWHLTSSWEK